MTAINTGFSFSGKTLQLLDTSNLTVKKLSDEQIARMEEVWKNQFRIPAGKPDNSDDNIYATVKVNGKVVATLYNSGASVTSNATGGRISNLPSMGEAETLVGPNLAQKRAEEIAKKLGGTIEKTSTAQTQWAARPPMEWTYDYKAMEAAQKEKDTRIQASKASYESYQATPKTKVDTQVIAQSPGESAKQEFMDFMTKSPEERMRALMLKQFGLTEEQLAAMPPDEREKIEQKIREKIREDIEKKTASETNTPNTVL